jgi:hypothetical protein
MMSAQRNGHGDSRPLCSAIGDCNPFSWPLDGQRPLFLVLDVVT